MIYIPPVTELSVYGVVACGVPNRERICLRPTEEINLAHFGVILGLQNPDGSSLPLKDQFYWFGDHIVEPPAWIILFTGPGQNTVVIEKGVPVHIFYWGKKNVLFLAQPDFKVLPLVFRIGTFNQVNLLAEERPPKQITG